MTILTRQDTPVEARLVCCECIGEVYVSDRIKASGQEAVCDYCDALAPTISIADLSADVEQAIDRHFERTPSEPEGYEYYIQRETGHWDRRGEAIADVIASLLEADEAVAEDVREALDEQTADFDSITAGEEQPFGDETHYVETSNVDHSALSEDYRLFERLVIEEARYFSPAARAILGGLFDRLEDLRTADGKSVVGDAGPERAISSFFRARVFQDVEPLKQALAFPDLELGPPPPRRGRAGRLNAAGVSVFYGADEPSTALAEVRAPVGSRVVTARFEILRPLRLLDLEALQLLLITGSLFDPEHLERLRHAGFLRSFGERFTRPVMPDHEAFEYIPTQAIADYLAHETDPALDGILYHSAQSGPEGVNVALFHKSSRVEVSEAPEGLKHHVWFGHETEDGVEQDYSVLEELPEANKAAPAEPARMIPRIPVIQDDDSPAEIDARIPALRIDTTTLTVHHINTVQVVSEPYPVSRQRIAQRDWKF